MTVSPYCEAGTGNRQDFLRVRVKIYKFRKKRLWKKFCNPAAELHLSISDFIYRFYDFIIQKVLILAAYTLNVIRKDNLLAPMKP